MCSHDGICLCSHDGNCCVRMVEGKCDTSLAFLTGGHSSSDNANESHSIFAGNTQTRLTTHSGENSDTFDSTQWRKVILRHELNSTFLTIQNQYSTNNPVFKTFYKNSIIAANHYSFKSLQLRDLTESIFHQKSSASTSVQSSNEMSR